MSDLIDRLKQQAEWLVKGSEYSTDETIYGDAINLIKQLQQRNDELAATVERLKSEVYEETRKAFIAGVEHSLKALSKGGLNRYEVRLYCKETSAKQYVDELKVRKHE